MGLVFDVQGIGLNRAVGVVLAELNDHVGPALTEAAKDIAVTARQDHDYVDRSQRLTRSIAVEPASGQLFAKNLTAEVSADAGHAAFIEVGTRAHRIPSLNNRNAKTLRFILGGQTVFRRSVQHPGTKPYRFLAKALEAEMARTTETVLDGALGAFRVAGFLVEG